MFTDYRDRGCGGVLGRPDPGYPLAKPGHAQTSLPPDFLLHAVAFAGLALLLMLSVTMAWRYRGQVAILSVVSLYGLVDETTHPVVGHNFMFVDLGADVA